MSSAYLRVSALLHAAAIPALAVAPRQWPWIAGTLVADHCGLVAGGLLPRSALLGPNLTHDAGAAARRAVALTFDDGPDPAVTPRVLDLLDAAGARATFFCIGERVLRHQTLAAEIAARGHRLENHTHTHRGDFFFHAPATLAREIALCQAAIAEASGSAPALFRAPAGIRSPLLARALASAGLSLCSWTRRGFDAVHGEPGGIAARLLRGVAPGDILVLHDGGGRDAGLRALPIVLDGLRDAGLTACPVSR